MTINQRLFITVYLNTLNATEAAYTVYKTNSRKSAAVIGSRLLRNVNVQKEINVALKANGLTLESSIDNLAAIANSRPEKITSDVVLKANIEMLKLMGLS